MNNKSSIAQLAFEAYSAERGNTAYDGSPIPEWDSAKPEIRNAWVTASATAVKAYMDEHRGNNWIDINTYSAQVRDLRRRNCLSQDELAKKAGLSRTYISLIERGEATNITVGALRQIFTALGQELPMRYPETGSGKWEYAIQFLQGPVSADEATLIGYGSEGWELVSVTPQTQENDSRAYFKRLIVV